MDSLEQRVDQLDADVLDLSKAFTDLLGMYLSLLDRIITLEHYVDTNNDMHRMVYEYMPPLLEEIHELCTTNRESVNDIITTMWPKVRGLEVSRTSRKSNNPTEEELRDIYSNKGEGWGGSI